MRRLTSRTSFRKRHERSNSLLRRLRVDRYRFSMSNDYFVALRGLKHPLYVLIDARCPRGAATWTADAFSAKGGSSGLRLPKIAVDS